MSTNDERYEKLEDVASELQKSNKKVQLIYALNGTGKTRLSLEFKKLLSSGVEVEQDNKILYYNAFTEDLFYWDNDLEFGCDRRLLINPDSDWIKNIINVEGDTVRIVKKFQSYLADNNNSNNVVLDASFSSDSSSVTFSSSIDGNTSDNIKISRGEESNFIWSVFYVFLEYVIEQLSLPEDDRRSREYDKLEYIFIDDPISSLDDRRIIDVALDLAKLIKSSNKENTNLKFIVTTHHALFYNVLHNELNGEKYTLRKIKRTYYLEKQQSDSPFAYHLMLKKELEDAIENNRLEKYHFTLLRNLLEKTATFLGYSTWGDCVILKDEEGNLEDSSLYIRKINQFSHSSHSDYEGKILEPEMQNVLKRVYEKFIENFNWKR